MATHKSPQPPPMAYSPHYEGKHGLPGTANLYYQRSDNKCSHGPSPISSHPPSSLDSAAMNGYPRSPSLNSQDLGRAVSEKSYSSGPSSPASSSYGPAVQSALRDSCHSIESAHSYRSQPLKPNDLEKQHGRNSRLSASSHPTRSRNHASSYGLPDTYDEESPQLQNKALRILIYLSSINCLVSFIILFYTLLALFATILLQPFRLCTTSASFRNQITGFLAPALKIQLAFIYSVSESDEYSVPMLVLVNLLSPLLSLGVAGASWVAAAFWFFNAILGDPDGSDKPRGYNDGRASVLGVRKWWESWLVRALR